MSFETSLSGINTTSVAMDVTGNNLANINVPGFKGSRAHFSDLFAASLASVASPQSVGLGAGPLGSAQIFTQGGVTGTNNPLDLAINGQGFFRLSDGGNISYSRNGQFQMVGEFDSTGTTHTIAELKAQKMLLVGPSGRHVTGYLSDATGAIQATAPRDISVASMVSGTATANVSLNVSLNPNAALAVDADGNAIPFDPNNPQSFNASTPVKTYDALGNAYDLRTYFVKTAAPNSWEVYTSLDKNLGSLDYPLTVTAGTNDQFSIQVGDGPATAATLSANPSGYADVAALAAGLQSAIDEALGAGEASVSLDADNNLVVRSTAGAAVTLAEGNGALANYFGAPAQLAGRMDFDVSGDPNPLIQKFTLNNGAGLPTIDLDLSDSTQYANKDFGGQDLLANFLTQDGSAKGELLGVNIGADGMVQARYSNGQTRSAAQLVLANFINPNGLEKSGLRWMETTQSGAAILDVPGSTAEGSQGLGPLVASATEDANVDISSELLNLITLQRAYQANSEAIKTQDKIYESLGNIR